MKTKLIICLIGIGINSMIAQSSSPEIISPAGETFNGNSMQLDWTLGELAITTIQNTSQVITQGFHQPTYIISNLTELSNRNGQINIYPNPTLNWIEMSLDFKHNTKLQIRLYNTEGKLIWEKDIQGKQFLEKIEVAELPSGNYFLNFLIDEEKYLQTYKIQKI